MRNDVLVVEISGKRAGTSKQRPTEKMAIEYPHIIVSNNSEGYETDWEIVNVPDDYREWYKNNIATNEKFYLAPMNRSYAIKYAREHGYKYLIQLDDNIDKMAIRYQVEDGEITKTYRANVHHEEAQALLEILITLLENTNAGISGCYMLGCSPPDRTFLSERYVYSMFALNLDIIPDYYQGDFEDDIEFRLKLAQMGIPSIMCVPIAYGKTSQHTTGDKTGCRAAYAEAGVQRGANMSKIHGDVYQRGMAAKTAGIRGKKDDGAHFKHKIKQVKVGVIVKDMEKIENEMRKLFAMFATESEPKYKLTTTGRDNAETD